MESSTTPPTPVDPTPPSESETSTTRPASGRPHSGATRQNQRILGQGRYSPVALTVEVVQLLHSQGVAVSEAVENVHQAVEASAELLRSIGVIPDKRALARPRDHTPELIAATVLLRAAGIEPSTVKIWPRRPA